MSMNLAPGAVPASVERDRPSCNRCPRCHPGKNYSEAFCRVPGCGCHRRDE